MFYSTELLSQFDFDSLTILTFEKSFYQIMGLGFFFQGSEGVSLCHEGGPVDVGGCEGRDGGRPRDLVHRHAGQRIHSVTGDGSFVAILQVLQWRYPKW